MRSLLTLLTLAQALWIDVPFVQQDKNGCGSASIWMILEYWRQGSAPRVEEIQHQLYSRDAGGIFARDMEEYFRSRGYRVFPFRGEWIDLDQHISQGRPLIVCLELNARGAPLHYVVVTGIDPLQNLVLVNDPAERKLLSMGRADFEQRWRAADNWTLLAVPEIALAGTAFRNEKLPEAKAHLKSALDAAPSDTYTNDFLATVYFLENNTESAVKYWNRVGKPFLENIHVDPPLRMNPVLLDRAFAFSRASVMDLDDFYTTEARLEGTDVFSRYQMELSPAEGDRFDLTLRAAEQNGPAWLSWMRGLPYETVHPEFFNLGGNAVNVRSMMRWDANKRRAYASITAPLRGNPKWGFYAAVDARRENWTGPGGAFQMRKTEAAAQIRSIPNGHWKWTSGFSVSNRHLPDTLLRGVLLKYSGSVTRTLLRNSDRGLRVDSSLLLEAGKLLVQNPDRFVKAENNVSVRWRPFSATLRAGRILGKAPFDEGFMLGLDRDSDRRLRAHSATLNGLKNAAFMNRSFVLTNLDLQKTVFHTGFFRLSAGPFLDAARLTNISHSLFDTGLQLRLAALGLLTLNLSYGRSLRDGGSAFFTDITR